MPPKLDLYKVHKQEYAATSKPEVVSIGPAKYLAIDGEGPPASEDFNCAVEALYAVAFTIKMTKKKAGGQDYVVSKLEGQWWINGNGDFLAAPKSSWKWKLLIRIPDFITQSDLEIAVATLLKKNKPSTVSQVRLESMDEGRCVQMLHLGSYDTETPNIRRMHDFAKQNASSPHGLHHEIYLSDPRRVAPAQLRTILRQPVR